MFNGKWQDISARGARNLRKAVAKPLSPLPSPPWHYQAITKPARPGHDKLSAMPAAPSPLLLSPWGASSSRISILSPVRERAGATPHSRLLSHPPSLLVGHWRPFLPRVAPSRRRSCLWRATPSRGRLLLWPRDQVVRRRDLELPDAQGCVGPRNPKRTTRGARAAPCGPSHGGPSENACLSFSQSPQPQLCAWLEFFAKAVLASSSVRLPALFRADVASAHITPLVALPSRASFRNVEWVLTGGSSALLPSTIARQSPGNCSPRPLRAAARTRRSLPVAWRTSHARPRGFRG